MHPKLHTHHSKIPIMFSDSTKLQKKKRVTFKNSFIKCERDPSKVRQSHPRRKSITVNLQLPFSFTEDDLNAKRSQPFDQLTNIYLNTQLQKKIPLQKKITIQQDPNFHPKPIKRNDLFLTMFNENLASTADSVSTIAIDEPRFSSYRKIIVSRKYTKNTHDDEGPFQAVQREIEKKKQALKKKSLSGLQKLSKKLLNDLKKQQKFDEKTSFMRQRQISYIHSRAQKKPQFFMNTPNRRSLQKSHQQVRSKSIECEVGQKKFSPKMRNCLKSCLKLIDSCKEAKKEQVLRKEVSIFTIYSKEFAKKCEKKYKSFERIKKAL